ncbi:hypothetical protein [Leptospira santarosai]|uniref:hypothetical protein n=1 Tax=Leptospira santarosai TaxID=28183 RepID=UPI0009B639EA|nr:hypothetical protein [Leptospira santarosai]
MRSKDERSIVSEIAKSRGANNSVPHFLWVVQHNVGSLQRKDESTVEARLSFPRATVGARLKLFLGQVLIFA